MRKATKRRLGVYSLGLLRNRELRRALAALGWEICPGPLTRQFDAVGVWGASPAARRGVLAAQRRGLPLIHLEDAPLRSVTAANSEPLMGLFLDETGNHLDFSAPSDLERRLNAPPGEISAETADVLAVYLASGLSKYNDAEGNPDDLPSEPFVLVVDQLRGDASITLGGATRATFLEMLSAAVQENPGRQIFVKRHPRALSRPELGHFEDLPAGVRYAPDAPGISDMLDRAEAVYTVTSQVGFEAILRGLRPRVFGAPFYAGWGLSDDEIDLPRRLAVHTPQSMFQRVMLEHSVWIDPYRGGRCSFLSALRGLEARRKSYQIRKRGAVALGMKPWKRTFLSGFLGSVHYVSSPALAAERSKSEGRALVAWASSPEQAALPPGTRHVRMEDGFLRSVGLGAALNVPHSLVLDDLGIYYDPSQESRLERQIIASANLPAQALARAEALRAKICELGLSKYNTGSTWQGAQEVSARRILVPGQVEDDASIKKGAQKVATNLALLQAVRARHPDAYIAYKPHPDVEAALRTGAVSRQDALTCANVVLKDVSAGDALAWADEIHTMTSLIGFEALLRHKLVVAYGTPFYAGWGLTQDLGGAVARRQNGITLAGLVHATLIDYPLYRDPVSGLACPVETIVDRLAEARAAPLSRISPLVRAGAKLRARFGR